MAQTGQLAVEPVPRTLSAGFEAIDYYPALALSRDRLLSAMGEGDRQAAVEIARSDVGLAIAVLQAVNLRTPGSAGSVAEAARALPSEEIEGIARRLPVFGFFPSTVAEGAAPVGFALHASAVQRAAARLAQDTGHEDREELLTAALLHDVGKLALIRAFPDYPSAARTPEECLERERRELGTDHAIVGGELARRWGLPARLVAAIECHHDPDAQGEAALLRLSDLLAHYQAGEAIEAVQVHKAALAVGLGREALGGMIYELTYPIHNGAASTEPCPLTSRELDVVRELAAGKVYKQIATDLGVSASTVRNHAHNAYRKLGVMDRAQAVLLATERGWL